MKAKGSDISRRSFLKIASTAAAATVLARCTTAPQAETAPTEAPKPAAGPVKIRYAHMNCWDEVMCKGQRDLIAEFNAAHPKIQVEPVEWSWSNYLATLTASVTAGEAPDVMNVGWGEVVSLGRPYFISIDSYLDDDLKSNIRPASWMSCKLGDQTFGVPVFEQLNEVLYYREDVWEKAGIAKEPETWEEFVAVAHQLQEAGIDDAWGMQAQGAPIVTRFLETQFQNGSEVFLQEGEKWKHTFDMPEAEEAARFWYSLWRDKKVISQSNLERSTSDLVPVFAEGKMGMLYDIVQAYFTLRQQYPDMADKIRIAPAMRKKTGATMGGAFSLSIFQQSKNKDAAWEFVKWACGADVMNKYWIPTTKVLPTRTDVNYPDMPDHILKRFQEYQAAQRVFPFVPEWEAVKGKVLTPILGEMASDGGVSFESGWKTIKEQTDFVIS